MAHWAELDEYNKVIRVTVGDNDDPKNDEGYQWLIDNLGGRWVQTSYHGTIRKNFAQPGYLYDEERDAFIAPKPFASWILNEDTCRYEPPIARPPEEAVLAWSEPDLQWVRVQDTNI
jgi:hypothetical protein